MPVGWNKKRQVYPGLKGDTDQDVQQLHKLA